MKNKLEKPEKKHRNYDKGQIFIKIVAGILAVLMVVGISGTLIFALLEQY